MVSNILLFLCIIPCITKVAAQCDPGWIGFEDSCYKISQTRKPWANAKADCESMKSHLVIVMSYDENDFLKDELRKLHTDHGNQFWMDGNDLQTEGQWLWESTGGRFEITNWHAGEPNQNAGEEDCLTFFATFDFEWNDEHCDKHYSYICERETKLTVVG